MFPVGTTATRAPAAHSGDTHHSRVEHPSAAFSMSAGSVQTRGGRYRRLRERVEGENLGTGAPPEFRAGGGSGSRGPQASHGVEMVARVAHSFSAVQRVRKNADLQRGGASYIVKKRGRSHATPPFSAGEQLAAKDWKFRGGSKKCRWSLDCLLLRCPGARFAPK